MNQTILLLVTDKEDETYLQKLLGAQYTCLTAASTEEAAGILDDDMKHVDLFVTDVILSEEDNPELYRKYHENTVFAHFPMITIVKEETPEIISAALKFENSEILRVPHQDEIILRRVSNMLRIKTTLDYRNVMEDVVAEEIEANIDALGICHCAKCRNDLLILTLNSLKPKYVSSLKGALLSRTDYMLQGRQTSVLTELVKAAAIIKERPRHN